MIYTYRISGGYDISLPSYSKPKDVAWEDGDPYEVVCMYVGCLRDSRWERLKTTTPKNAVVTL